jgi:hypothetical protein
METEIRYEYLVSFSAPPPEPSTLPRAPQILSDHLFPGCQVRMVAGTVATPTEVFRGALPLPELSNFYPKLFVDCFLLPSFQFVVH